MNLKENIQRIKEMIEFLNEDVCIHCDEKTNLIINNLNPELQILAKKFVDNVKNELGLDITITSGTRTFEEQDKLYCKGRTNDKYCINKKLPTYGNIVTYKKGGEGNHNFGKAIDVYFKKNGKIITDKLITPEVAQIGKNLGLTWGGDWKNFKDFPHFELK